jgi:hypothetical protein
MVYGQYLNYENNPAILYALNGLRVSGGYNEYLVDEHKNYL